MALTLIGLVTAELAAVAAIVTTIVALAWTGRRTPRSPVPGQAPSEPALFEAGPPPPRRRTRIGFWLWRRTHPVASVRRNGTMRGVLAVPMVAVRQRGFEVWPRGTQVTVTWRRGDTQVERLADEAQV